MSRRHQVIWRCDRCGAEETVKAKSDHLPGGWRQQENHQGLPIDLCAVCLESYAALFDRFLNEVRHPEVEEHTVIDDELLELDPEVDNEA